MMIINIIAKFIITIFYIYFFIILYGEILKSISNKLTFMRNKYKHLLILTNKKYSKEGFEKFLKKIILYTKIRVTILMVLLGVVIYFIW